MIKRILIVLLLAVAAHSWVFSSQIRNVRPNITKQPILTRSLNSRHSLPLKWRENNNNDIDNANYLLSSSSIDSLWPWILMSSFVGVGALQFSGSILPIIAPAAAESISTVTTNLFDPATFQPVCPASDSFYQVAKTLANTLVGAENVIEYGPLIASVLLRIRLELCVFESFLYEAVMPFIKEKGLSWILPLHETLETFIAGTVFAISSNFILLGSTKIFTVLLIYLDAIFGWPNRAIGGLIQRVISYKTNAVANTVGQVMKIVGDVVGATRRTVEVIDTFVGRYLVFGTTVYIVFKFLHYKFFNGIFP